MANVKLSALEFKTAYCRKFPKIIEAIEKAFYSDMFINVGGRLFDRQMLKFEYSEEGNIKIYIPLCGISGEKLSKFGKILNNLFVEFENGKVVIIIRLNYDSN